MKLHIGLDVGSTTVKLVIIDEDNNLKYSEYRRHRSDVEETVRDVIKKAYEKTDYKDADITIMVTGSGGMFVEKYLKIPFIQEVVSCKSDSANISSLVRPLLSGSPGANFFLSFSS